MFITNLFKDIDVKEIRQFLYDCLNNISTENIENIRGSMAGEYLWNCGARKNCLKAVDTLIDGRYKTLEETIKKAIEKLYKIETIKNYSYSYEAKYRELKSNEDKLNKAILSFDAEAVEKYKNLIRIDQSNLLSIKTKITDLLAELS